MMVTTKKARRVRSTSTPSIPPASTIEIESLKAQVSNLKRINGELHDIAQRQGAALRRAEAAEAVMRAEKADAEKAGKLALQLRIQLARKEGYIDRVRETDAISTTPVRNPAPGELLEDVREAMLAADEGTFGRMVDSMGNDTINRVLGDDGSRHEILR